SSPTQCWAVGSYRKGIVSQTLIEFWNGTSWTIVPSPNTNASEDNVLSGVTCSSASQCWAVGFYTNSISHRDQTLIQQWDGTSWSIAISPNTNITEHNRLSDVTCSSGS